MDDAAREHGDVRTRAVWVFAFGLLGLVALASVATWWLMTGLQRGGPLTFSGGPRLPEVTDMPRPGLAPTPALELQRFRAHEEQLLHGYAWVDEQAGVASIPIGRAIELRLAGQRAVVRPIEEGFPDGGEPPDEERGRRPGERGAAGEREEEEDGR